MTGWLATTAAATAVASVATLGSAMNAQSVRIQTDRDPMVKLFALGGRLGVSVRDISDEDLKTVKGAAQGVIVEDVEAETPAEKAGIKKGDVIVEFDGERVRTTRQFTRLVQESPLERAVPLVVSRDGQRVSLNVSRKREDSSSFFFDGYLGSKAAKVLPPLPSKIEGLFSYGGRLGISIQDLSPQLAEYFGTKDGVLVTSVTESSNASRAGLKAGDVITSFNGQTVDDTSALSRRSQRLEAGDEFTIAVMRDKKPLTLKGKLEEPQPKRLNGPRTVI